MRQKGAETYRAVEAQMHIKRSVREMWGSRNHEQEEAEKEERGGRLVVARD